MTERLWRQQTALIVALSSSEEVLICFAPKVQKGGDVAVASKECDGSIADELND